MSYGEITEDLKTSVGELTILMNDTFTSCMKNYEALLPYLEKKETKPKIYNKLVHVNMLLNKLNEELVCLRVQYVTVLSYQQKTECVLSEGSRKRRISHVSEVGRCKPKSLKTEMPFSNITNHSVTLFPETGINQQPENFLAINIEETKHAQVQKSDVLCAKNIKSEIQDSDEVVVVLEVPKGNSDGHAAHTLCDTINNAGSEENPSVEDKLIGGNEYDKPTDDTFLPLQNVESETRNQGKCEDNGNVLSKHQDIDRGLRGEVRCTTSLSCQERKPFSGLESHVALTMCDNKSAELVENSHNRGKNKAPCSPVRDEKEDILVPTLDEEYSEEIDTYGIIRHKKKQFKCTLCSCALHSRFVLYDHLKGKKHKRKLTAVKKNRCAKVPEVSNDSCTSTASVSVCSEVPYSHEKTVLSNSCESTAPGSQCLAVASSLTDTVPNNSGQSATSVTVCSDISCSLADTVAIVEDRHQVISMKHAVRLDDVWRYFPATFRINKQFFRIRSGKVVCSLCNEKVGRYLHNVKTHISRLSHLDRINVLQNNELANRSSENGC